MWKEYIRTHSFENVYVRNFGYVELKNKHCANKFINDIGILPILCHPEEFLSDGILSFNHLPPSVVMMCF